MAGIRRDSRPGTLRVIVHPPLDGALNMAIDDVLLDGLLSSFDFTLRLYGWRTPTVSLGYGQRWTDGFDRGAAGSAAVRLVRRRTGGRAVMHAHELTYAVVGPADRGVLAGGVQDTYRRISTGLLQGLADLGVEATLERSSGRRERTEPGACFGSRARYELVASGGKLLGSAQRRTQRRVLQHGSLPLWPPDAALWRCLGPSGPPAAAASVGLRELVHPAPGRRRLVHGLAEGVAAELGLEARYADLSRREMRAAVARAAHYRDPAHTYRR